MNLIKFPSPNLTNNPNKASTSLPYQDWEIDEVIENLSEDEQDLLIEKISVLAQSWELTLDSELETFLQTKYKESKTTFAYADWLYDLAQEEVYRAYAIEQLDKQKGKVSIADKKGNQTLADSNAQTATTTAATSIDVSADQTTNNNSLLNDEEQQINQIIENLSEGQQDALMEKTVFLFDHWESTTDEGLKLALKLQHQKSQPNIPYQDFLYELAQSQVYREYAVEQLELAKQSNSFGLIEPFTEIEKVYCDKANSVDELTFDEPIFDNASQDTNNVDVQLLEANNYTIINDEITSSSNSDIFIREKPIFDDVSRSAKENAVNKRTNLDCHQWDVGNNQGYRERITSSKDCVDYHITGALPKGCNFFIKFTSGQTRYLSSRPDSKNSLSLINVHKILLMPINQGKLTSFHHPPSLPP